MSGIVDRIANGLKRRWRMRMLRVRQRRAANGIPIVPEPPVWQFPAGMTVQEVPGTGVRIIDNFCSEDEAAQLIEIGRSTVQRSTVIGPDGSSIYHDYRTSSDYLTRLVDADPLMVRLSQRAAALFGLPVTHAETFSLTRYGHSEYYKSHFDHDGSLKADRLYTVLLYLNDLAEDEGGGTLFEKLNLVTRPVRGRAVVWVNSDTGRQVIPETMHSALPVVGEHAEKWVAQMWFRAYEVSADVTPAARTDQQPGQPLTPDSRLPEGISFYQEQSQPKHD